VWKLADKLAERLRQSKKLTDVWANPESTPQPQLYLDIDREKAKEAGVSLNDITTTLQVYFGPVYINDFIRFGRTWRMVVQEAADPRKDPDDLKQLKVRTAKGEMVPLSHLVTVRKVSGPQVINRFDMEPMVELTANPASGVTLAEARTLCERLAQDVLPAQYRLTWLQEMPAGK
jgi:multidrug efflux pump subunit AcrB